MWDNIDRVSKLNPMSDVESTGDQPLHGHASALTGESRDIKL